MPPGDWLETRVPDPQPLNVKNRWKHLLYCAGKFQPASLQSKTDDHNVAGGLSVGRAVSMSALYPQKQCVDFEYQLF